MIVSKHFESLSGGSGTLVFGPFRPGTWIVDIRVHTWAATGPPGGVFDIAVGPSPDSPFNESARIAEEWSTNSDGSTIVPGRDSLIRVEHVIEPSNPFVVVRVTEDGDPGALVGQVGIITNRVPAANPRDYGTDAVRSREAKQEPRPSGEPVPVL